MVVTPTKIAVYRRTVASHQGWPYKGCLLPTMPSGLLPVSVIPKSYPHTMENTKRSQQNSASWRSKRQTGGAYSDPKKRAKADRERFRRGKRGSYKRLNDLFLDGLDTGRERRVYALVMTVTKGRHATVRYSTYNSHPSDDWVPPANDVVCIPEDNIHALVANIQFNQADHWPKTDAWTPIDFDETKSTKQCAGPRPRTGRLFTISKPPPLNLDGIPRLK